jgi:hypothetical protein
VKLSALSIIAVVSAVLCCDASEPPDLTRASAHVFKDHIGHVVSLRGRLELGKGGGVLLGATRRAVVFYLIPRMPSGGYTWPPRLDRLFHRQVRVTGTLRFEAFDHSHDSPEVQAAEDHYYMIVQDTQFEGVDSR